MGANLGAGPTTVKLASPRVQHWRRGDGRRYTRIPAYGVSSDVAR